MTAESVLRNLLGLRIFTAGHAADMREFGLRHPDASDDSPEAEWFLHIQCSWRIESLSQIVTGSFDWFEPADRSQEMRPNWDPATGGSLQDSNLREVFQDPQRGDRRIQNRTDKLVVIEANSDNFGDLLVVLSGGFRLRVFPAGSRGEFWRVFKKGDLDSHFICEGQNAAEGHEAEGEAEGRGREDRR